MTRGPDSLITALGFTRNQEQLYFRILAQSGRDVASVAQALLCEVDELTADVAPFVADGLVRIEGGLILVSTPDEAVVSLLGDAASSAARAESRLRDLASAIPFLNSKVLHPRVGNVHAIEPLQGEVTRGGDVPGLLATLLGQSHGDVLLMRPDQWRVPLLDPDYDPDADPVVRLLRFTIGQGRRVRSLYPIRARHEAADQMARQAAIGEEIRFLPELPTRMVLLGRNHAILPEPLGFTDEPRALIHQPAIVEALILWFEDMWERAAPLIDSAGPNSPTDQRRFLLQQLAGGAQDEQIARRLNLSLRTVRRRVAELMAELEAESRFQAGVEAVRRGWL